jgi:hypothetical protein
LLIKRVPGGVRLPGLFKGKKLTLYMKEIRKDLYTQAEYARLVGKTRAWVNQQIKNGTLKTLVVNGATLIKV